MDGILIFSLKSESPEKVQKNRKRFSSKSFVWIFFSKIRLQTFLPIVATFQEVKCEMNLQNKIFLVKLRKMRILIKIRSRIACEKLANNYSEITLKYSGSFTKPFNRCFLLIQI